MLSYTPQTLRLAIDLAHSLHVPSTAPPPEAAIRLAFLRGVLKLREGAWEDALGDLEPAANQAPSWTDLHEAIAEALFALDRNAESLSHLATVLDHRPDDAMLWANKAELLSRLYQNEDALQAADQALALNPNAADVHLLHGRTLGRLDRTQAAQASFAAAAALNPTSPDPWMDASTAWLNANCAREALACAEQALSRDPQSQRATYALAQAKLDLGDLGAGWRAFESRWDHPHLRGAHLITDRPKWLGETPLRGRAILLWGEQGFGDMLQFCRYAPLVARDADVTLFVPPPLVRLLRTLPGASRVVDAPADLPPFDCHAPLMSLPLAMNTTAETIPAATPYLSADPTSVADWTARLADHATLKVGLVWSAHPRLYNPDLQWTSRRKSASLHHFAPLAQLPGILFVSLQIREDGAEQEPPPPGMEWLDPTAELHDFADTAALVQALDLVITVDTAVAHLAGALGKPVWILLPWKCCWRWSRRRVTSPWYPTARLFRQPAPGDWDSVIAAVGAALQTWLR